MPLTNQDPLLPGYSFNAHLVSGLTTIDRNGKLDFFIDRPQGMRGYIINYTHKGSGIIYRDQDAFICSPGDFILFPEGEPHFYGRKPTSEDWYHYWVYFLPKSEWLEWLQWETKMGKIGLYQPIAQNSKDLEKLFIEIVDAGQSSDVYSEILAMNLLEKFLITRMQIQARSYKTANKDERIFLACKYIMDSLNDNGPILDKIARQIYLSPSRLSHLFKEQMNVSLLKWREEQRINRARILLHTTSIPISDISREVGYDDPLYFSRLFHKKIGCSPTQFRRLFINNKRGELTTDAPTRIENEA